MSEKKETIADIVTEMRDLGKLDEKSTDKIPRSLMGLGLRTYADRIEAAWKRDEKHAVEHATHHAEAVASANCRDCIYNPRGENYEGGNVAAKRFFRDRGISPTLKEFKEVVSSYMNGTKPMGIH